MHKSTSCYRSFWSSMYLWTTDRDTAPTEEMDALLVQSVGNLVYRSGYLPRIFHALMPFSRWTQRMMPKRGLQSMSRPTWSGITSISRIWKWYYPATSRKISFRSWSLGGGQHLPPVLWAKDDMVLAAEHQMLRGMVLFFGIVIFHMYYPPPQKP